MTKLLLLLGGVCLANTGAAQTLSLPQLITLRTLGSVPAIDDYLSARGWQFDKGDTQENFDQVVWVHKYPGGLRGNDAALNVIFCNLCSNLACDQCTLHADTTARRQHAVTLLYKPTQVAAFNAIKSQAVANKMSVTSAVYARNLRTVYTGQTYELGMNRRPDSFDVQLSRKLE